MQLRISIFPTTRGEKIVIRLFDPESAKETRNIDLQLPQAVTVNLLVFSPDGKVLAARPSNGSALQLYDTQNLKELHKLGDDVQLLHDIHERVPVILGSSEEVDHVAARL